MDCEYVENLLTAYILGLLNDERRTIIEAHLRDCGDCKSLFETLEMANVHEGDNGVIAQNSDVLHMLPHALAMVSPLQPPPTLKNRIMEAIDAAEVEDITLANKTLAHNPAPLPNVKPFSIAQKPRQKFRVSASLGLMAASFVGVLLLMTASLLVGVGLGQRSVAQNVVTNPPSQQMIALKIADNAKSIKCVLRPVDHAISGSSYATLYTHPDIPYIVAVVNGLPQPPAGQAYYLWLTDDGKTTLAGTITPDSQGFGLLVAPTDDPGSIYGKAQITLQPIDSTDFSGNPLLLWQGDQVSD